MLNDRVTITKLALSLIVSLAGSTAAVAPSFAGPSAVAGDYFANTTPQADLPRIAKPAEKPVNNIGLSPLATMSARTPIVSWFEASDDLIAKYEPTDFERVVMDKPFNQEAERVQIWTRTAAKIAHNYRTLAKALRASQIPGNHPELKEYIEQRADWYADAAGIYEELIKPRPPAKTIEELNAALADIKERSTALGETNKRLISMDMSLRKEFKVHLARNTDPIWQFAHGGK